MGGMCSPSGGINPPAEGRSLPRDGKPNSRSDLYDENGDLTQSRWYDPNGWAMWDRDFMHGDIYNDHTFPHDHEWKWNPKTGKPERVSDNLPENPDFC